MQTEAGQRLKGVVFDYSVLLVTESDAKLLGELRAVLETLRSLELKLVVFSTHPQSVEGELKKRGLPPVDKVLTKADVRNAKGRPLIGSPVSENTPSRQLVNRGKCPLVRQGEVKCET